MALVRFQPLVRRLDLEHVRYPFIEREKDVRDRLGVGYFLPICCVFCHKGLSIGQSARSSALLLLSLKMENLTRPVESIPPIDSEISEQPAAVQNRRQTRSKKRGKPAGE